MSNLTDQEMRSLLVDIISDGFNRSLNALEEAGAINTRELRSAYSGIGSKYYDLVTEQIDTQLNTGQLGSIACSLIVRPMRARRHIVDLPFAPLLAIGRLTLPPN